MISGTKQGAHTDSIDIKKLNKTSFDFFLNHVYVSTYPRRPEEGTKSSVFGRAVSAQGKSLLKSQIDLKKIKQNIRLSLQWGLSGSNLLLWLVGWF